MKVVCPECKKQLSITAITRHTRIFHPDIKKIRITITKLHEGKSPKVTNIPTNSSHL